MEISLLKNKEKRLSQIKADKELSRENMKKYVHNHDLWTFYEKSFMSLTDKMVIVSHQITQIIINL